MSNLDTDPEVATTLEEAAIPRTIRADFRQLPQEHQQALLQAAEHDPAGAWADQSPAALAEVAADTCAARRSVLFAEYLGQVASTEFEVDDEVQRQKQVEELDARHQAADAALVAERDGWLDTAARGARTTLDSYRRAEAAADPAKVAQVTQRLEQLLMVGPQAVADYLQPLVEAGEAERLACVSACNSQLLFQRNMDSPPPYAGQVAGILTAYMQTVEPPALVVARRTLDAVARAKQESKFRGNR